jgi:HSP20 family protein
MQPSSKPGGNALPIEVLKELNMRSMIPWGRSRGAVAPRSTDEGFPFMTLHRQMNRLFDDFFRDFDTPMAGRNGWSMGWPHVDVSETDKEVKVTAELPGLTEKDVELTLSDGYLTLKGEKKLEHKDQVYSEIWQGSFERTLDVGEVDPDKVNAQFRNGVLTVSMEKRPDAQSKMKRIPISAR